MSNLVKHAEREMRIAGLYDSDSDYGGMIPENVIECVEAFSKAGHSGGSAHLTIEVLNRVLRHKTLAPINSDPQYWMEVGHNVWQSTRDPSYFSINGGTTFYCLDDPEKKNWPADKL